MTDDELLAAMREDIPASDRLYYLGECVVMIVAVFAVVAFCAGWI